MSWKDILIAVKKGIIPSKQELVDGTTTVGNSEKLGGKGASEYMTHGENLYSSVIDKALSIPQGVYYFHLGGSNYSGNDLPHNSWAYGSAMIIKRNAYSIEVLLFAESISAFAINSYNGAKWNGWSINATTADLANYLSLSGGTVKGNVMASADNTSARTVGIYNSVRKIYHQILEDGRYRIADITNGKDIISSTKDGTTTFNGTASGNLPLNGGGSVKKAGYDVVELENTSYFNSFVTFKGTNGICGSLGFLNVNKPTFLNSAQNTFYDLHHDGNSAKVIVSNTPLTAEGSVRVW